MIVRPAGWVFATIIVAGISAAAFASIVDAGPDAEFEVAVTSSSHAEIVESGTFGSERVMVATRIHDPSAPKFVAIEGDLVNLNVLRYEAAWANAGSQHRGDGVRPAPPRVESLPFERAAIEWVRHGPEAALVAVADSMTGNAAEPAWLLRGVAQDPAVGFEGARETYGAAPGPNEIVAWTETGRFLVSEPGALHANLTGSTHLYWFQGTIRLRYDGGILDLESRVWDDPALRPGQPYVRHVVWYELYAGGSALSVELSPRRIAHTTVFSGSLIFERFASVAFDSARNVEGSLPPTSGAVGPSLWMTGQMRATLETIPQSSSYRAIVSGNIEAYSFGGVSTRFLSPQVTGLTLLTALLASLYFMRDLLAHGAARVAVPLYSKLRQDSLLDHSTRYEILQHINTQPGISFLALRHSSHGGPSARFLGTGTLLHHLDKLHRFGLISSRRVGRFRRYFANDPQGRGAARTALVRSGLPRTIAKILLLNAGISQSELHRLVARHNPVTLPAVRYHLARMEKAQLVASTRRDRRRVYEPTALMLVSADLQGQDD